mgnify:CR=1 FL=1
MLIGFAVQHGLKIVIRNLESFYLCGTLDKKMAPIHMRQVKGFEVPGKEEWLCHIVKGL